MVPNRCSGDQKCSTKFLVRCSPYSERLGNTGPGESNISQYANIHPNTDNKKMTSFKDGPKRMHVTPSKIKKSVFK